MYRPLFVLAIIIAITQAAYIRRDEYTMASNCTEASRFKSAYYLVDSCTPPANVRYTYNSGNINVQYFGDAACSTGGSGNSGFTLNQCIHGTSTDYSHAYVETLPALAAGQTTYAIYDRTQAACSGLLQYLVQATPVCYLNADGSFKSATTVCSGNSQTLTRCTDTACSEGCVVTTSQLTDACSSTDHDINSCGAPSTISGTPSGSGTPAGSSGTPAGSTGTNNSGATGTPAGTTGTNNSGNNNGNTNNASTTSSIQQPVGSGAATSTSSFLVSLAVLVVIGVLLL